MLDVGGGEMMKGAYFLVKKLKCTQTLLQGRKHYIEGVQIKCIKNRKQ